MNPGDALYMLLSEMPSPPDEPWRQRVRDVLDGNTTPLSDVFASSHTGLYAAVCEALRALGCEVIETTRDDKHIIKVCAPASQAWLEFEVEPIGSANVEAGSDFASWTSEQWREWERW